jgi:RNA polymerase nonessential primary-like sigma factor
MSKERLGATPIDDLLEAEVAEAETIAGTEAGAEEVRAIEAELDTQTPRREAILAIVKYHKERGTPRVGFEVGRYKTEDPGPEPEDTSDGVARFRWEIGHYRLLTRQDEQSLFRRLETGLDAYHELDGSIERADPAQERSLVDVAAVHEIVFMTNQRLVAYVAKPYEGLGIPFMDLILKGNEGLSDVIGKFDHRRGYKFSSPAIWWIRNKIQLGIANELRTIRLPANQHDAWLRLGRITNNLVDQLGREPTDEELSQESGWPTERVEILRRRGVLDLVSLNQESGPSEDGAARELGDTIAANDTREADLEQLSHQKQLEEWMLEAPLEPREKIILCLRFGVYIGQLERTTVTIDKVEKSYDEIMELSRNKEDIYEAMPLSAVGKIFNITPERVRKIQNKSLSKLRAYAEAQTHDKDPLFSSGSGRSYRGLLDGLRYSRPGF